MKVFEVRGLEKSRRGGDFVLRVPELIIEGGKTYAVAGPNGAGKTTFLRVLNGLEVFGDGRIFFMGKDTAGAEGRRLLRRRCTLVMHPPALFSGSIRRNVAFGARSRGLRGGALRAVVGAVLRDVNMEGWEARDAGRLSAGEGKRVSIARALAFAPDVLCIDEPTADLDAGNAEIIERILRDIRERGMTLVFSCLKRGRALSIADEIVSIENGRVGGMRKK